MQTAVAQALVGFLILSGTSSAVPQEPPSTSASTSEVYMGKALQTFNVSMTGYNAVPAQTDDDPNTTASGAFSDPNIVAARSVDLADKLPFGTVIEIDSVPTQSSWCGFSAVQKYIGLRVIADSMAERMHNRIDILFSTDASVMQGGIMRNAANALGICKNVVVKVVGHVDIAKIPKSQGELADAISSGGKFAVSK